MDIMIHGHLGENNIFETAIPANHPIRSKIRAQNEFDIVCSNRSFSCGSNIRSDYGCILNTRCGPNISECSLVVEGALDEASMLQAFAAYFSSSTARTLEIRFEDIHAQPEMAFPMVTWVLLFSAFSNISRLHLYFPPSHLEAFQVLGGYGLAPGQPLPLASLKHLDTAGVHTGPRGLSTIECLGRSLRKRRLQGFLPLGISIETFEFDDETDDQDLFTEVAEEINSSGNDSVSWGEG
jgi:hypothetical protein